MAAVTPSQLSDAVAATAAESALVSRLAEAADRAVRRYLGRAFVAGPFTELHPGGRTLLIVEHFPVAAVTGVAVDPAGGFGPATVRPAASYVVHAERGVIESRDGPFGPRRPAAVQVTYTADEAVPDTVTQAALMLAAHWYREAKTHAATGQLNVGTAADGTAYPWGQAGGYRLPPAVTRLLDLERVPAV
jgi:hypothetical protein